MLEESNPSSSTSAGAVPAGHRRSKMPLNYYARFATAEARRFRQGFTRENIVAFLKTLAWTIPITVIIWVYAEQQTTINETNVSIRIEIKSSDPNKIVTLIRPEESVITVDLTGPHSNIDRFKQSPDNPLAITIEDASAATNEIRIPTLDSIRGNAFFKDQGVAVTGCSPPQMVVDIDMLDERQVPVVAPANLLSLQSAIFTPATIKIKGPHRVLETMATANRLSVTADIANLPTLNVPGQNAPVSVPLIPPESGSNITFETTTVQATLTVKAADVQYELGKVNVEIQGPQALFEAYRISPEEPFISSIKVVGPQGKIDLLRNHQAFPIAVMHVEPNDVQNHRPMSLEIRYLPDGVQLAPDQNPTMNFVAEPR